MAAFLCFLSLISLGPRITTERVCDVATLLTELGQKSGHWLRSDDVFANCMVYTRLDGADFEATLNGLARGLAAEWDRTQEPWRLTRKAALRSAVERQEALGFENQIWSFLARRTAHRSQNAADYERVLTEAMERPGAPADVRGPIDDLLTDLLIEIGPAELARTKAYEMRAFSNQATRAETALPLSSRTAFARFQALERVLGESLARRGSEKWDDETRRRIFEATQKPAADGRALVEVSRTDGAFWLNLNVFGRNGMRRTWASAQVRLEDGPAAPPQGAPFLPRPNLPKEGYGETTEDATLALRRTLDPFRFDPLRLQAVPGLARMAREPRLQVLVFLPDRVVPDLLQTPPNDAEAFLSALSRSGVEIQSADGWLTGRLRYPNAVARLCLPRRPLATWLAELQKSGGNPFRSHIRFAAACGDALSTSPLDDWYREAVFLATFGRTAPAIRVSRWLSFFLGSLSDAEWKTLEDGGAVSLGSSTARIRWMRDWSDSDVVALEPNADGPPVPDVLRRGSSAFPNALPAGAALTLDDATSVYVRSGPSEPWEDLDGLSGWIASKIDRPTPERVAEALSGEFELGVQTQLRFRARFTPALSKTEEQSVGEVRTTHSRLAFERWTAPIRQRLLARVAESFAHRREGDRNLAQPR